MSCFWSHRGRTDCKGKALGIKLLERIPRSNAFDAAVYFNAVIRDPSRPVRMSPDFDPGDHIHPKDLGNKAMADVFDLFKHIPFLDVTAVYSKEQETLFINVVNRHKERAISTDIVSSTGSFTGNAYISEIKRKDINARYKFDGKDQYVPAVSEKKVKGGGMVWSFPAHSFTQIKVKVSR